MRRLHSVCTDVLKKQKALVFQGLLDWWTQQEYARTIAEVPYSVTLLITEGPPQYQIIAEKVQHLHQLGLSMNRISKLLKVNDKTVKKALLWISPE